MGQYQLIWLPDNTRAKTSYSFIRLNQVPPPIMDVDRIMMSADTHGSLLNRVYELQCIRDKEEATASMKERADMELEKLSLALTNMCQVEDKMELEEEEDCHSCEKYSQARARSDPVYILQQQQHQLQLQHQQQQQQQNMIAFSSFVSHQQLCQPQQL